MEFDPDATPFGEVRPDDGWALPPPPEPKPGRRLASALVVLALGATGGALIGHAAWRAVEARPTSGSSNGGFAPNGSNGDGFPFGGGFLGNGGSGNSNTSDGPTDAAAIARDVDPGIVDITTTLSNGQAAGTGMVITPSGEVLTNNHVIDGANSISVRDVGNGRTYNATVVGYDRTQDIAILQLSAASGLSTITPASSEPASGAAVVGIGNAGGVGGTPSYAGGSITHTGATITASDQYDGTSEQLSGLLATDAAIESGDSGGPLVNTSGEVVGMDTAATEGDGINGFGIVGPGGATDRGYAIPIVTALQIARQIESRQASDTVHIGPTAKLGVYVSSADSGAPGAQIVQLENGSPAAAAGLQPGEVITSINGTPVSSPNDLSDVIATLAPGDRVTVTFLSTGGARSSVTATLGTGAPQ